MVFVIADEKQFACGDGSLTKKVIKLPLSTSVVKYFLVSAEIRSLNACLAMFARINFNASGALALNQDLKRGWVRKTSISSQAFDESIFWFGKIPIPDYGIPELTAFVLNETGVDERGLISYIIVGEIL